MDCGVDITASGAGLLFVDDFFSDGECCESRQTERGGACIIFFWKKENRVNTEWRERR